MERCLDCESDLYVVGSRCVHCRRIHAIQSHLLKLFLMREYDWFGADRMATD